MDELVRWLGEQLDEDERIARATLWDDDAALGSGSWYAYDRGPREGFREARWVVIDRADEGVVDSRPQAANDEAVARHIAAHDPARVLREVARKRQMLRDADDFCAEYDAEIDNDNSAAQRAYCWRDTIRRNLAADYAHQPGYLEEWAPTD